MMAKKAAGKGHHNDIGDLNKKQMKKMMKRIKKMKMARMEKEGVEGYNPKWMKKVSVSRLDLQTIDYRQKIELANKISKWERSKPIL